MDPADLIAKEEDDVSLPRAALNKLIKDAAPEARLTLEARELMLQISHEFIHKLAGQANLACNQASKKTIMADHVLTALEMMGLNHYREIAKSASEEAREEVKLRKAQTSRFKFQHQTEEDYKIMVELQQKMFEQARAQFELETSANDVDLQQIVIQNNQPESANNSHSNHNNAVNNENDDDYYD